MLNDLEKKTGIKVNVFDGTHLFNNCAADADGVQ